VKVTQRIPVNISIEGAKLDTLRAGMSAVVNVDTKPEGSVPETSKAN
jgi:multidrug resistance efflux pump